MKSPVIYSAFCVLALLGSAQAAPSVVSLDTGEQVIGELLPTSTAETVVLRSALLGEVRFPRARVHSIQKQVLASTAKPQAKPQAEPQAEPEVKPAAESQPESKQSIAESKELATRAEERQILDTVRELTAPDHWSGNVRLGLNLSEGDRKWTETYARGQLEIKPPNSPHFFRYGGSYTYRQTERADGSEFKSTDKYDAQFIYRRSFQENWFVQNSIGGRVDQIKGIERELQEAVGIGYNFKPSDTLEILIGGGGGIEELQTDYADTRSGLNPLANVFQEATWKPLKRTSVVQKFNYYWNPEDTEQFNYVFTAAIRVRLTDLLGLEFSFNKSFDNDVGDGNAQDDTQWRNALVVYF